MFGINSIKLIILTSLTLTSFAHAKETIVGGTNVSASDTIASTTVALYFAGSTAGEGSICTGSILDSGTILTAAHCVANAKKGVVIFATDIKNNSPANTRTITAAKVYAKLNNANVAAEQRDIATVSFLGGLPAGFKPAQFLSQTSLHSVLQAGGSIILAGYGVTSYNPADKAGSSKTAGTLRKVSTKIEKVGTSNLWVGFVGKTACHGDSGGPAFVNYQGSLYLVGVTSRSTRPNGDCSGDSIYTQFAGLSSFASMF
jgi:secreted trypsin-like serine protease